MKRFWTICSLWLACMTTATQITTAQIPVVEIIKQGITKVIVAVDLKIQRLQNKTIWLQSAQKTLENSMQQLHLDEITDWVEKQRVLYADYFEELRKVKAVFTYYQRVKDIIEQQVQIIKEYKTAWELFRQDKTFTPDELDHMTGVYAGMIKESKENIDDLFLIINSFVTQMTDSKRLEMINSIAELTEETLMDLKKFNHENKMLSLQRAVETNEIERIRKLYGL